MLTRASLLASALVAVATPAAADQRSEAILGDFIAWIDSSPLWTASAGAVRSEGADTLIADLSIGLEDMAGFTTTVEEIRLTALAAQKGGGFTADRLALTGAATIWNVPPTPENPTGSARMEYSIPSATMTGVVMPSFAGVAFDPNHAISSIVDIYAAAAEGAFTAFDIPEMTFAVREGSPNTPGAVESNATYRDLHVGALADGVIQSQTAGPISGGTTQSGMPPVSYTIDRLESGPVDLGAMIRILDDDQYEGGRGDGVWMPIVSDVAYLGFTATGEGFTFNLDSITLDSLEGRQMDEAVMEDLDALIAEGMAGNPEPVDEQRMLDLVLGLYSAWRVGTFSMDGLGVDAGQQGTFALGNMTLAGLSEEGLDRFAMSGFDLTSPEAVASLGLFEITDVVWPNIRPLVFGEDIAPAGGDPRDAEARSILAAIPRIGHIGLHDAAGGAGSEPQLSVDTVTLDFSDWNEVYAGATDFVIEGLAVSRDIPGLDAQTLQMMDTLGYDELVFGASLTDRWSPEEGSDEAVWTFSLENGADIEVSYELTGITAEWVIDSISAGENQATQMKLLSRLGLAGAELRLTDRSLLERGFNAAAMLQGLTVDGPTYREQIRGAIPFMLSTALPQALATMIGGPIQSYVGGGQTLIAEINPTEPVSLLDLANAQYGDPAETAENLGLTVRTEPAAELESP